MLTLARFLHTRLNRQRMAQLRQHCAKALLMIVNCAISDLPEFIFFPFLFSAWSQAHECAIALTYE
jgi:hypothetical protein